VIAILAALLPTIDPITLLLEMIPMILLYEGSIVLASILGRKDAPDAEIAPAAGS